MAPNVFVAIKITDKQLIANFRAAQASCVKNEHQMKDFILPTEKAHLGLVVFNVPEDRLEEAKKVLREALEANQEELKDKEKISFEGLSIFGSTVLWARPVNGVDFLHKLNRILRNALEKNSFVVTDNKTYIPHVTLFNANGKRKPGSNFRDIPKDCYKEVASKAFGTQTIENIQFLSMQKEIDLSGYYYCEESYNL